MRRVSGASSRSRGAAPGRTVAVVLGAGQGTRMGAERNKVLLPLAGKPILVWAIEAFERARQVNEVLLVAHPREVGECRALTGQYGLRKVHGVIAGGATRHQSEYCALNALRERIERGEIGMVLIHDGARPLVSPQEIARLVSAARETGAALLATPVEAGTTLAEMGEDGEIAAMYPAGRLWRAQTPQAFEARALLDAYDAAARAGFEGTDTAASLERAGRSVRVVPGSLRNVKLTTPDDLARVERMTRANAKATKEKKVHEGG